MFFGEAMGFGDVMLMGVVGLASGFWQPTVVAMLLGMVAGGVGAILILTFGSKGRKEAIPYGPFLVVGAFAAYVWGEPIWEWYVDILSPAASLWGLAC